LEFGFISPVDWSKFRERRNYTLELVISRCKVEIGFVLGWMGEPVVVIGEEGVDLAVLL
jgi:hypothetical protein